MCELISLFLNYLEFWASKLCKKYTISNNKINFKYIFHEVYNMTVSFEKPIKNQRQKVARQNRKHSFYVCMYISFTRTHLFHHIKN